MGNRLTYYILESDPGNYLFGIAINLNVDYKGYKQMGCGIIGSGAIESAHRTVIQKRMKLAGQRWSKDGAQNMLHLRVTSMYGQWNKIIIQLAKTDFKAAA